MNTRVKVVFAAAIAALSAVACRNPLDAVNQQSPDIGRVYLQPASIETAIAGGYQQCHNQAANTDMMKQMETMSFEYYSQLNNFNSGPVNAIPRAPLLNTKTATTLGAGTFQTFSRQARNAVNAIRALDALVKGGGTLGTDAQNNRARAFAWFVIACNQTWLAAGYDSAAAVDPGMPSDSVPPLVGYKTLTAATLAALDTAIAIASKPGVSSSGGFPTPTLWMSGPTLSATGFIQLMRSWKARVRTITTRSKAERDALDWAAVLADAQNGITADQVINVGGTTGWTYDWQGNGAYVSAAWQQVNPEIVGFADVSCAVGSGSACPAGYDLFISQPWLSRGLFLIQTPDLRFPAGATRAAQQAASVSPSTYLSRPYIKNGTEDAPGDAWGQSYYRWQRFQYYALGGLQGAVPEFLSAENDMTEAEAAIRTGNFTLAATLIDKTRVSRGGLPPVSGVLLTANDRIPGPNCVPRVPAGPNFTSTQCADIFETMKYEKRIEGAMYRLGMWFMDGRGWQNLFISTPLHYPVPVTEIDARYGVAAHYYNIGGGGIDSAPASLYGWPIP